VSHTFSTVPIGETVSKVSTCDPRTELAEGLFEYIDISLVNRETKRVEGSNRIAAEDAPIRARQIVKARDILVSTVRPNLNAVAQVPDELDGAIASTGFTILRPKKSVIDARYLFQWVKSPQFIARMVEKATGASYPAVSDRIVKDSMIPLPPLDEQRRIAAVLDKADDLREKRRQAINKLDTLLQAVFLDMFGDPVKNPKRFKVSKLENSIKLKGGFAFKSGDYVGSGIPLVKIGEVNRAEFKPEGLSFLPESFLSTHSKFVLYPDDLLMSLTGTTGKEDYANVIMLGNDYDKYFLNQRVALIQPDESTYTKEYLFHLFKDLGIKRQITDKSRGIRQANISNGDVLHLKVPTPPLELQVKFSKVVTIVKKLREQQCSSASRSSDLFGSLQQHAFNGELFNGKATAALPQQTMTTSQPELFD
jgi:type I restriction enzyme S subunit